MLYDFDFEAGLQGFAIDNSYGVGGGLWHWSTGRGQNPGHSATHSVYYGHNEGANGGGNYDTGNTNAGVAVSPGLTLAGAPVTLSFSYLAAVEPVFPTTYQSDLMVVEVSTNSGASYTAVASKGAGLNNNTAGSWATNVADLSGFLGSNVRLRFRFDTIDPYVNGSEGWYIDDVRITGLPQPGLAFQSVTQSNGLIYFSWNAAPDQGYQVQYKTNLGQANWLNLGTPLTNATMPVSTGMGPEEARFYRLQAVP